MPQGPDTVVPFTIEVPEAVLVDLRERLAKTRWPDEIENAGWDYGTSGVYLRELVEYWQDGFDWRKQERLLNSFPGFRADVDGFGLHFLHVRGTGPAPMPLLMVHGWPSTFAEMIKVLGPLTDPVAHGGTAHDAFDVVVPSLPGFGFSDRPTKRGMNVRRVSELFIRLMTERLGYPTFGMQGGDWGGVITNWMGYAYPSHVVGISLTQLVARRVHPSPDQAGAGVPPVPRPVRRVASHAALNRQTPQTLGYGLNDSPVGLAAWIVEKYQQWGNPGDGIHTFEDVYTKDEMLTTVMIYWVTQTSASAARLYHEDYHEPTHLPRGERIGLPAGMFLARQPDGTHASREQQEQNYADIRRWTVQPTDGHFAALEQPDMLVDEIRAFFRPLRS